MLKVDGIECPFCGEQLWSRHRHDFRYCGCGYCYIDGGRDYIRCGWGLEYEPEWARLHTKLIGEPKPIKIKVRE